MPYLSFTDYSALCRIASYAPTAPVLPPGNPALSSYIPWSDCTVPGASATATALPKRKFQKIEKEEKKTAKKKKQK